MPDDTLPLEVRVSLADRLDDASRLMLLGDVARSEAQLVNLLGAIVAARARAKAVA